MLYTLLVCMCYDILLVAFYPLLLLVFYAILPLCSMLFYLLRGTHRKQATIYWTFEAETYANAANMDYL